MSDTLYVEYYEVQHLNFFDEWSPVTRCYATHGNYQPSSEKAWDLAHANAMKIIQHETENGYKARLVKVREMKERTPVSEHAPVGVKPQVPNTFGPSVPNED